MVLNVASPETTTELETVYLTLGKILGGSVDGAKTGEDSYKDLIDTMKTYKAEVNSNVPKQFAICTLREISSILSTAEHTAICFWDTQVR